MNLTKAAIARPVFIFMLMLAAMVMGIISYQSMTKELNPKVNFGVVTILTTYPGADPEAVNNLVSRRLEQAASGVAGVQSVTSNSQEGVSIVVVQFNLERNLDQGLNDLRSRVDQVVDSLPEDASRPVVSKIDTTSAPLMYLAISSDKLSSAELRDLVDDRIKDRFARINGVANAGISGGDVREIQVRMRRDDLVRYNVGITDVQRAISAANVNIPAGRLVDRDREYAVRVPAEFTSPEDIANLTFSVPTANGDRRLIRLGDVADVQDTIQERTETARTNGQETILLVVQKSDEGNALALAEAVKAEVKAIEGEYKDQGIKFLVTGDESKRIAESLLDLNFSVGFGIVLVCLIVYVFLHDLRGTIIVALAIPTCLLGSFIALKAAGFTINNLSMLALSLAVGVLVDDAIVVLENIYRHLKMGEDPREAAINGRAEIGLAAIAITLADVVVFLPIAFVSGIVGQFFKPLALSYVFAVLFSLFVSFTLTPMLAARWYRAGEDIEHPKGRFARWFERQFGKLERAYGRALEWSLNHRWFVFSLGNLVLLAVIVMIVGSNMPDLKGAISVGIGFITLGVIFGLGLFAINFWRLKARPLGPITTGTVAYVVAYLLGAVLGSMIIANAPPMVPKAAPLVVVVGFLIGTVFIGLYSLFANLVGTPVARTRIVASAAAFGLIFLAASVGGYAWRQYKGESIFKFSFFPESDSGRVAVNVELPSGASLAATDQVIRRIENVVKNDPDVEFYNSSVGTQGAGQFASGSSGSNYGQISLTLYEKRAVQDTLAPWMHKGGRLRSDSADAVAQRLQSAIGRIPGARVTVSASDGFGIGSPIQFALRGDDARQLQETANKIREKLAGGAVEGLINVDLSSKPGKPELQAVIDRTRLADAGVTAAEVAQSLRTLYTGDTTPKLRVRGREYVIRTMLDLEDRDDPAVLQTIPVKVVNGKPVTLASVSEMREGQSVDRIERRDQQQQILVRADLLPGKAAGSIQQEINTYLARENLLPEGVTIKPLGQAESQGREGPALLLALVLGLMLVYMLLASLYDNLLYPFIIQLAQPQAFVGALLALMITDKAFSLIGFIGLITLIGLVGKNAILLVDYTNTLRDRGRDRHDALVEAGPTRLRPIVMTTLALVLGTLPVAVALGRGSEFRQTIGIVIIGGISLSTLLTLLVIPTSYTIFDDFSNFLAERRRAKQARRDARRALREGRAPDLPSRPATPA